MIDTNQEYTEIGQKHTWLQHRGEVMGEQSRLGGVVHKGGGF